MDLQELLGNEYKEDMTLDEVKEVLKNIKLHDNSSEIERLKNALNKSNSEAANYKKQLREKSTEEEQKAQQLAEERAELERNYQTLLRDSNISKTKVKFLSLGYDDTLADEVSIALVDNDLDKVFSTMQKHYKNLENKIRTEVLKETPKPVGGTGNKSMSVEEFKKLSPLERLNFSQNNPEEYQKLYKGE